MAQKSTPLDYAISQKVVHWLMAFLISMDLVIAQSFGGIMEDAVRFASRSDHAGVGTIIAILFAIRIYLRWTRGAPALPSHLPVWQKRLAHTAHWTLYALIGGLIVTGMLSAITANSVVEPFGLFAYGDGTGRVEAYSIVRTLHEFCTKAIIAVIALHVAAALYHLGVHRGGVTKKMLVFWSSNSRGTSNDPDLIS